MHSDFSGSDPLPVMIRASRIVVLALGIFLFQNVLFQNGAHAQTPVGRIIKEARCKVLIRAQLNVSKGDILSIVRKPNSSGSVETIGRLKVLRTSVGKITAQVIEPRSDCARLKGAFVVGQFGGRAVPASSSRKGPPPAIRGILSVGPGFVTSTFKGISRASVNETYPLALTSINVSGDLFPFSLGVSQTSEPTTTWQSVVGVEGAYRYVMSLSDVQVTVPAPNSGQETGLNLAVKRMMVRGGLLLRVPVWKGRLFLDGRGGYYFHRLATNITKFVKTSGEDTQPFELSPLRDLGLRGFFMMGGFQFRPVDSFRVKVSAGTVLAANYTIDNRLPDAPLSTTPVNAAVSLPRTFILDASLNYLFSKVQLGIDLNLESFSGTAFFPDGLSEDQVGEIYTGFGLSAAFLL